MAEQAIERGAPGKSAVFGARVRLAFEAVGALYYSVARHIFASTDPPVSADRIGVQEH